MRTITELKSQLGKVQERKAKEIKNLLAQTGKDGSEATNNAFTVLYEEGYHRACELAVSYAEPFNDDDHSTDTALHYVRNAVDLVAMAPSNTSSGRVSRIKTELNRDGAIKFWNDLKDWMRL